MYDMNACVLYMHNMYVHSSHKCNAKPQVCIVSVGIERERERGGHAMDSG